MDIYGKSEEEADDDQAAQVGGGAGAQGGPPQGAVAPIYPAATNIPPTRRQGAFGRKEVIPFNRKRRVYAGT